MPLLLQLRTSWERQDGSDASRPSTPSPRTGANRSSSTCDGTTLFARFFDGVYELCWLTIEGSPRPRRLDGQAGSRQTSSLRRPCATTKPSRRSSKRSRSRIFPICKSPRATLPPMGTFAGASSLHRTSAELIEPLQSDQCRVHPDRSRRRAVPRAEHVRVHLHGRRHAPTVPSRRRRLAAGLRRHLRLLPRPPV